MALDATIPDNFIATRNSLHQLAEHVISAARYQREQRIGLRATPNGFGTPANSEWQIRVDGTELVFLHNKNERREPITTLAAAAKFTESKLGAPDNVYKPTTDCEPDATLIIDPDSAQFLAQWIDFSNGELAKFREALNSPDSSEIQMWPEHFDLALEAGNESAGLRAGYGGSPGDEHYNAPYFYVVPWNQDNQNAIWNAVGFKGLVATWSELSTASDPSALVQSLFDNARKAIESPT